VGSQRCGTTWIDNALRCTGRVLLPKNKQTYFFDRNYKLGIAWYEQQFEALDKVEYELVGEVATGYCLNGAVDLLYENYPDAKIILAVREPVSRAYSNYVKRKVNYHDKTFEEALNSDVDLVERGLYGDMLRRILRYYSSEKVKVVFFDDLENNARKYLREITDFLNLDCDVDEKLFSQNVNSSLLSGLSEFAKKIKLNFLIYIIKRMGLTSYIRALIYKLHKLKRQPAVLRSAQLHKIFDNSNKVLEGLCKRDLRAWRESVK
jgi:hypothetical protein